MQTTPLRYLGTPAATAAAGCPARYHFWLGTSGQRYLFSEIETDALGHFRGVVALLARPESDGTLSVRRLVAMETATDLRALQRHIDRRTKVMVHLLAGTPAGRDAVVSDLLPDPAEPEIAWAMAA
mgnify:CR=1 FL=1